MTQTIWTVLRSGGEYTAHHVLELEANLAKHAPAATLKCITDEQGFRDLCHFSERWDQLRTYTHYGPTGQWPGWWFKAHIYGPWNDNESLLYCDLDTRFCGPLDDLFATTGSIVLRDFYRGGAGIGSGLMRMSKNMRMRIWSAWIESPNVWMEALGVRGDQGFLEQFLRQENHAGIPTDFERWQDVLPGQIVSYKKHCRDDLTPGDSAGTGKPPVDARVVCFHGHPRPWHVEGTPSW